jgi:hypothetical protein
VDVSCHLPPTKIKQERFNMVKIKGKEYRLKFTIGFWKKIKEDCGVIQENMEKRLNEDFGNVASKIVYYGIYYGLPNKPENINEMEVSLNDIESDLDRSVVDDIEQALIDGMTEAEKRAVELVKKKRDKQYADIEKEIEGKKKE